MLARSRVSRVLWPTRWIRALRHGWPL